MEYNNSQRGVLTYVLSILAILSLIVFAFNPSFESELEPYIIGSVFIAVLVMFYRLTIKVNNERIRVSFGIGLIAFNVKPDIVLSTEIIKTKLWWGIGIRLTPHDWLYNVSTGPALLIKYEKNELAKKLFVGTNQPEKLQEAIHANFHS